MNAARGQEAGEDREQHVARDLHCPVLRPGHQHAEASEQAGREVDERVLMEQLPEEVDADELEQLLPQRQQQPTHAGHHADHLQRERVLPGQGEQIVVGRGEATKRQVDLQVGQGDESDEGHRHRERPQRGGRCRARRAGHAPRGPGRRRAKQCRHQRGVGPEPGVVEALQRKLHHARHDEHQRVPGHLPGQVRQDRPALLVGIRDEVQQQAL